jgi:hypothetical protein
MRARRTVSCIATATTPCAQRQVRVRSSLLFVFGWNRMSSGSTPRVDAQNVRSTAMSWSAWYWTPTEGTRPDNRCSQPAAMATTAGSEFVSDVVFRLRLYPSAIYSTTKSRNVGCRTSSSYSAQPVRRPSRAAPVLRLHREVALALTVGGAALATEGQVPDPIVDRRLRKRQALGELIDRQVLLSP